MLGAHMHRDYRGQLVGLVFEHCRDHSTGLLRANDFFGLRIAGLTMRLCPIRQRWVDNSPTGYLQVGGLKSVRLMSQCNIRQDALAGVGECGHRQGRPAVTTMAGVDERGRPMTRDQHRINSSRLAAL